VAYAVSKLEKPVEDEVEGLKQSSHLPNRFK